MEVEYSCLDSQALLNYVEESKDLKVSKVQTLNSQEEHRDRLVEDVDERLPIGRSRVPNFR